MDSDVEDVIYAHMYFEEFPGVQEVLGEADCMCSVSKGSLIIPITES